MNQLRGNSGRLAAILCWSLVTLGWSLVQAQGVSVAPSRILLDGRARAATVFLSNRSNESETYRISLAYYVMDEDGTLIRSDATADDADDFAGRVLRYSPRRVVIPAGGSQTIRLLVRRPRDEQIDDREFRAHLSVCSVPSVPHLKEVEQTLPEVDDDKFLAQPVASVETLVPIVVRFGHPEATLDLAGAAIVRDPESGAPAVRFTIERTGGRSLYGDLSVTHRDLGGNETELYFGRGVAVYAPNTRRVFTIAPDGSSLDLRSGSILVEYRETRDGGGDLADVLEIHPAQLSQR
jgi:hypothetical protein